MWKEVPRTLMAPLDDKWKMTLCTTSSEVPIDEGIFSGPVSLTDSVRPENDDVNHLPCGVPLYVSMAVCSRLRRREVGCRSEDGRVDSYQPSCVY